MFLSPSAICLLGLIAWTLLLVFLLVSQRGLLVLGGRMAVNAFAADGSNTPGGFGQRLVRVHANCVENLPLLAGALLIVWCVFELVYLPNPVSVIYLVIGLVQTACAVVMRPAR